MFTPLQGVAARRDVALDGKIANELLQSTNTAYTVSKLPALPDRLRADTTGMSRLLGRRYIIVLC